MLRSEFRNIEINMKTRRYNMQRFLNVALIAVALIFVCGLFTSARAGQKGSETKGRHFFRETCRQCHTKGAAGGEVNPLNKTMAQWRDYFAKGTHNHGKEPLTKYLPADQLLDASTFLIQHAADSPQPETCGK
jgi:mono/diheme cytochrome c family protein